MEKRYKINAIYPTVCPYLVLRKTCRQSKTKKLSNVGIWERDALKQEGFTSGSILMWQFFSNTLADKVQCVWKQQQQLLFMKSNHTTTTWQSRRPRFNKPTRPVNSLEDSAASILGKIDLSKANGEWSVLPGTEICRTKAVECTRIHYYTRNTKAKNTRGDLCRKYWKILHKK